MFFETLQSAIEEAAFSSPVAIILSSEKTFKHVITIGYDKGQFFCINIDNAPTQYITQISEIAQKVREAFGAKQNEVVSLFTHVYSQDIAFDDIVSKWIAQLENKRKLDQAQRMEIIEWVNAIYSNDIEKIKALLKTMAPEELNKPLINGKSRLNIAVEEGHLDIVKILLSTQGIDVEQPTSYGNTDLREAVKNNNIEIVEALLAAGADANKLSAGMYSYTCTPCGCANGPHLVQMNKLQQTPLELAKENKYTQVELAIEKQLNQSSVTAKKRSDTTVLYNVSKKRRIDTEDTQEEFKAHMDVVPKYSGCSIL